MISACVRTGRSTGIVTNDKDFRDSVRGEDVMEGCEERSDEQKRCG